MTITITDEEYQELMLAKREHKKLKLHLEAELADLKSCLDLNTDEHGLPIDYSMELLLNSEIAEIEELLE